MGHPSPHPIDELLRALWERSGSDLLLTAGSPPLVRVDGLLQTLVGHGPMDAAATEKLIFAVLGDELAGRFAERKEVDFALSWAGKARLRGNAFQQRGSVALALRLIPFHIPSFEELRLPPVAESWVTKPHGLVLVTGPTGSGKSTTLASMIDYVNTRHALHIITIEDPIEYVHEHKLSAINQRAVGIDTDSFHTALRSALREDPDVVLVGEMRDLESIQATLTVAETGHLVFATLHTNDSAQTLDRIVDVFPAAQQPQVRLQLANTLIGILNQQLVPKVGGGRVAAFEVLVGTHGVRNLIREGKTRQIRNLIATGQKEAMQTLEASLSDLVAAGLTSHDDAMAHSAHPKEVQPLPTAYEPAIELSSRRTWR